MSDYHLSETEYASLPLSADLQQGIQEAGFKFCTPIQALTLPVALAGKDVSGQAQTGTGKTAAFLIATFETLIRNTQKANTKQNDNADDQVASTEPEDKKTSAKQNKSLNNPIRAIMIAPTRELAKQIFDDAKPLNKKTKYKLALAYGGTDYDKQRVKIEKGCDILIGTPGRIIDYFKQNIFSLGELEVLVLDEADRMFDMGFISDIRYLFKAMPAPQNRQSLLFSATMSERVKELAYEHMDSPETVVVESEQVTAEKIEEIGYMPANEEKIPLTLGILQNHAQSKSIVFINTKHQGEKLQNWLEANQFKSGLLSGDVPQKKRERLLKKFKDDEINCLVATDVAARGLHIDGVDIVINFDLPNDAEDYVHRIGRTARAGASGQAISLICETFGMNIMDIEAYIDHKIPLGKDYSALLPDSLKRPTEKPQRVKNKSKAKDVEHKKKPQKNQSKPIKAKEDSHQLEQDSLNNNRNRYMRRKNNLKEIPAIG